MTHPSNQFGLLIDEMAAQRRRRDQARAAPAPGPVLRANRSFRPSLPAQDTGASLSKAVSGFSKLLADTNEIAASIKLGGFAPGMGCRLEGDPIAWQIERIDPDGGRVRIRQMPSPEWKNFPGVKVELPPGMWVKPSRLSREKIWDDPEKAGTPFTKALSDATAGADLAARQADLKARARRRVAVERHALVAGLRAGNVTPHDATLAEALLIRFENRMGI